MHIPKHRGIDWSDFDYRRLDYYTQQHHERYVKRMGVQVPKLTCQACRGRGGYKKIICHDEGTGPWEQCGWCEGTGLVTPHRRGEWLRMQKALKKDYLDSIPHATLGGYYN